MMRLLILLTAMLFMLSCEQVDKASTASDGMLLTDTMSGDPKTGFARALKPREFSFPEDHAAHEDYATEWWYFTGNLKDRAGRLFGYQLTIFRVGLEPGKPENDSNWRSHQVYMGHMAISDIQSSLHKSGEIFSRAALSQAGAALNPLRIWLGPWSIQSKSKNLFPLDLTAEFDDIAIKLRLNEGSKPIVLQGKNGLSQKGEEPGNASYYYSYTRLPTLGSLYINGQSFEVSGNSWFDREWSSSALAEDQQGWDWFSLQLDDGRDLMFYRMRNKQGNAQRFSKGVLIDHEGKVTQLDLDNTVVEPKSTWQSPQGDNYPVTWSLRVADHDLDIVIEAFFNEQLMQHTVTYWEGAVNVSGSHSGQGYMELSGYAGAN
ncbi:MAG: carotenoid 1,2-hydratase [Gammaproteobacteria bacterium]|nr:carotenoid 1,2-hydratase [Gammaproteobacteria bacterium]